MIIATTPKVGRASASVGALHLFARYSQREAHTLDRPCCHQKATGVNLTSIERRLKPRNGGGRILLCPYQTSALRAPSAAGQPR